MWSWATCPGLENSAVGFLRLEGLVKVEVGREDFRDEPIMNTFNVINIKSHLLTWPRGFVTLAHDNFSIFNSVWPVHTRPSNTSQAHLQKAFPDLLPSTAACLPLFFPYHFISNSSYCTRVI